ncbi:bifunctional (p)ppGpp synthetase/guanosine-3',5'-bis(diphosphate) 3'-pyrophosphohydrolase [Candidatus Pacearchaeota archaeon]|nr:bifunctional (p)ppGpp synthetase/guanosine-3',5'-bis(diphosphate) 3'-pyrophosphohydrolase [Candidatus Pacearchaeota archaeon]
MKNKERFLELCERKYSNKDLRLINKSIEFVELNLVGEKEFSRTPLSEFNLDVGEILVMSGLSAEIVVAGILYGVEKDLAFKDIAMEFGEEIAKIVFGQLQLRVIKKNNTLVQAEMVRKILLTGLDDVRVVFVKLAVKLANLRIISALKEKEQRRIAEDILEIYVPLAMRLGLDYIKNNLEDLAFKTLHPRKYEEISNFFKETKSEREEFLRKFIEELGEILKPRVGVVKIKGRNKQIKSIFDKIHKRGEPLSKQKDHYAIRIIVKGERDCYDVLGILHERFIPVEGRLKDYINSPKLSGYQSLHTVVRVSVGNADGKREAGDENAKEIEVQIRTEKMDEEAEEGIASHWNYKGVSGDAGFEKKVGWMKALMESQRDSTDKEFMKNLKLDLFADKIYCYTPKGDVRELPKDATLLDFAYSIHQQIGERAIGGRIDGKFVSLKEVLKNGCVVEILTNKNQRPRRDWLKFVVSSRAKSKIRQGIKRYESIPVPKKPNILIGDERDFDSLVESADFLRSDFSFAKCCYPLPKDELLGVAKSQKKILVHKSDCPRLAGNLKNAVPVFWKEKFNRPLRLKALCGDRSGILADLLNTISRGGFVVRSANARIVGNGDVECDFVVIPRGLDDVCWMVGRVGKVRGVSQVFFE